MERNVDSLIKLYDALAEFAVAYGFQLLGALVFLAIGRKLAGWIGARIARLAEGRGLDVTLSRFIGNVTKFLLLGTVVVITLGNFGIAIAPLIALAGAAAFGATFAIQGPLSNYGAGLAIVLARPFVVGDTIEVKGASGVVEEVTLAHTVLTGEDGQRIIVPNKEIVGEILVNSEARRVVEGRLLIDYGEDVERAIVVIRATLGEFSELGEEPAPLVGIEDFDLGGVVLGLRYWVPSRRYFETRYAVNGAVLAALGEAGIPLVPAARAVIATTTRERERG